MLCARSFLCQLDVQQGLCASLHNEAAQVSLRPRSSGELVALGGILPLCVTHESFVFLLPSSPVTHCLVLFSLAPPCNRLLGTKHQAECHTLERQIWRQATTVFLDVREVWSQRPSSIRSSSLGRACFGQMPSGHTCPRWFLGVC